MTDRIERLSRAIATFHEPMPTWPPSFTPAHPLIGAPCTPDGWWVWHVTYVIDVNEDTQAPVPRGSWKHVDCMQAWVSMRLLKALLANPDWQVIIGDCDDKETSPACVEFELTPTEAAYAKGLRGFVKRWPLEQLGEGIGETFAKSVGLEVE